MSELKPCPFCGGEVEVNAAYWDCHGEKYESGCANPQCLVHPYSDLYDTEAEAIEAWNTRAEMGYEDVSILLDELGVSEQTCEELGSVRIWQECDVWSHELSCGHEVDTLDMEPPRFCPNCGAKVVSE